MFLVLGILQVVLLILFIKRLVKKNSSPIAIVSKILIFALLISVIKYFLINYFFNPGYPNSTFLFNPDDRFGDFVNMIEACKYLDPYSLLNKLPSVYFPVSNLFFYLVFALCKMDINISIIFFISLFLILLFVMLSKNINASKEQTIFFFIAILLSYPILFSIDRLNLELYLFIFTFLFIYFYNKKQYIIAVTFLSLPICMKLYPIVFLLILLKKKAYKPIIFTFILCVFITIVSLSLFKGGILINLNKLLFNLNDFNNDYEGLSGIQHNLSIYGLIKIGMLSMYKYFFNYESNIINDIVNSNLKIPYLCFVFIYFISLSAYILFIEKTFWKNIFLIISMFILLPHVSFDYKLLYIIIPLILFLQNTHLENRSTIFSILLSLLMIPNSYFYFISDVSIGVIINPILILTISFLIIYENKKNIFFKFGELYSNFKIKISNSQTN
jgi:hypothetical protein